VILITSASGMTGLAAVRALARRGFGPKISGVARSQASKAAILRAGASNFISGDLRDTESISRSMRGIETVFHICPRMQPDEVEIGEAVITAAEKAGVARFVLHSVISSQIDDIVFHAAKRAVELSLIKSKLAFTILQPNSYMQNLSWSWSDILQHSQFVMPYSAEVPMHWVDVNDYGEAAAEVISNPEYDFGAFECVGTERPINRHDIARLLTAILQREIRAITMPIEDYLKQPRWLNRPPAEMDRLKTMFRFMDAHGGGTGNRKVLAMLLGKSPSTYEEFLKRFVREMGHTENRMKSELCR